ncbi:serine hydrolase domain-containing protein [Maribacter halichondriae]|uniref:serine hydrolase domain-containing protein n=1 Tax=Maribacter halichondriae TaxID=2980554 RepID=UPI002358CBD6|nr:serine hydrolase domain-containing protein [Maribacter sp. Hal144]
MNADNILISLIKGNKTPSVHYIFFDAERVIHRFKGGLADIKNKEQVSDQTSYAAFSVTKTFTALAVLQLAENKKINLDESIKKYLPKFTYGAEISVRNLLNHTAGIPNPNPLSWIHLEEEHTSFDNKLFFDSIFIKHNKTKSKPNEKFNYSNLGYVLLGQLIEKISGQTYENYIRNHILKPIDIPPAKLDFEIHEGTKLAKGYQKRLSFMNLLLGFFIDKSKFMAKAEGKWKPFRKNYVNGSSYGGLMGTPDAFVKYLQELLKPNCALLSAEFKKMLFTEKRTNDDKATGMCCSWFTGMLNQEPYFTHAGGGGGYYCEVRIYTEIGMGSVIMFNRSGMRDERFLDKLDSFFIENKK